MRFAEKVALVTGGGSGIGRHVALSLVREGATVAIAGRRTAALDEVPGVAYRRSADVTREADASAMVEAVISRYGRLDVAVNAAGVLAGAGASLADLDAADWERTIATNLTGVFHSLKHEIAAMRPTGGTIVTVASNLGAHGRRPGLGAYVASKAAVSALIRNTALEYLRDGIRINAVSPGPADTTMSLRPGETTDDRAARLATGSPIGRVASLGEITAAILWLASDEASYVSGTDLVVDGAATA